MGFMQRVKQALVASVGPVAFLLLVAYFGWNATQGEHGLKSYALRQTQLIELQADLKTVQADRDRLERRVAGLRTSRIDPDTLDERARAMLNVADPADVVVMYDRDKKLF